jgi:basic secretory peptidase family protein
MFMKRLFLALFVLVFLATILSSCLPTQPNSASHHPTPTNTGANDQSTPITTSPGQIYHLKIQGADSTLNTYVANALQEFAIVYPQLVKRWSADPKKEPPTVTLQFEKNLGNPAETAGGNLIKVDIDYARANPYDPGVLTHELTHVVQRYPTYVVWLTEAIANYSSQLYGPRREETFRSASKYIPDTTYTSNPYDTGSRFLFWISQNKRRDIVDRLNRILQANTYTPNSFVQLTGQTLDQLWAEYQDDHGNVFTLQNKTPEQIYRSVTTLVPDLTAQFTTTDTEQWQAIQGKHASCGYQGASYTVNTGTTNTFLPCASNTLVGHNFAYQADMTITEGDGGGLIGRGVGSKGMRFRVGSDGSFDLTNGQTTLISSASNTAIKQGKQTNTLLMAVEDKETYLYVNGHYLGHASDTYTGGGYFGFMAVNFGKTTSIKYQNVKIWQW